MKRLIFVILAVTSALTVRADQGINQKKGFNADNVYYANDIDTINAFNGNLTVTVPIGRRYPLAEGFSYGFTAVSNGNVWDAENTFDPVDTDFEFNRSIGSEAEGLCNSEDGVLFAHPHRRANAGIGWIVTLGRLFDPQANGGWSELVSQWTYESPDGSDHKFGDGANGTVTADGSYLRMLYDSAQQTRTIEFPDGTRHIFKQTSMGGAWLPTRIENQFGAFVNIAYKGPSDSVPGELIEANTYQWRLSDSHGRSHRVNFKKYNWEGSGRYLVDNIALTAFNGQVATYKFHYTQHAIGRQDWSEKCTGYTVNATIQTLDRIEFPDDPTTTTEGVTNYSFVYDTRIDWLGPSGSMTEATLPTGGRIKWAYGQYAQARFDFAAPSPWIDMSWGVTTREVLPPAGTTGTTSTWKYSYLLNADYDFNTVADNNEFVHEGRALSTDPLGNQTLSFFSSFVCDPISCSQPGPLPYWWNEYAKPFTRDHTDGGMYLSEVQYPPGVVVDRDNPLVGAIRAKYVQYESDFPPVQNPPDDENWRMKATRIKHFNNAVTPATSEWVDTKSSDWDGFGHYRVTETSGSTTTKKKKSTTNYNPHLTPTTIVPVGKKWILNTYSFVKNEYDGQVAQTDVCFDTETTSSYPTTGFITRKRTLRGGTEPRADLLAVYVADPDGNLDSEQYYGGDANLLPAGFNTCKDPLGTALYSLSHLYSFGVRKQTQYAGAPFKSLDLTVDLSGLAASSRDTAGVETSFVYNPEGQLRKAIPDGEAWTEYSYNVNPTAAPFGTVTVKQWPSGVTNTGTPLTESRYYYDANGRIVQQATSQGTLAAGANGAVRWAASATTYDKLGRKATVSAPISRLSASYGSIVALTTKFTYDELGRTTKVEQPDKSVIETAYPLPSLLIRTSKVLSQTIAGADTVLSVVTKEAYDPFGHLIAVTENAGTDQLPGEALVTSYTYDEGDRLVGVQAGVQNRSFAYDGAGLLTSEQHPESGTTSYTYDARGHVKQQITPTATVISNYDAAERIVSLTHNGQTLKSFTYDTATTGLGKVATATRINDHGAVGRYTVKETFTYKPVTGRIDSKTTEVVKVRNNVTESTTSFADKYEYDELGANTSVKYPECTGCGTLPPLTRTVQNAYSSGMLQSVPGYTKNFTYHPNGLLAELSRVNVGGGTGPTYKQEIADGMPRPSSISVTGQCTNLTIDTPLPASKTVAMNAPAGLSVGATGATGYEWYEVGSTAVLSTSQELNVLVTHTTSYFVRVLNGTCSLDSTESLVNVSVTLPTATTNTPTSITQTAATFNGSANANGNSTNTSFEYGLTAGYGSSITAQTLTGTTTQPISAAVTGLACGTTFHVRAKATNAGGSAFGADTTFTTLACTQTTPPAVATGVITGITQNSATFTGTVNPNGASTTTAFDYGLTMSYGSVTSAQPLSGSTTQSISSTVGGLACGTTYHVRARGTNASGTNFGIDRSFNTEPCSTPCAPEEIAYNTSIGRELTLNSCTASARGSNFYAGIFSFTGAVGDHVQIDMSSSQPGFDAYVYLVDPNGNIAAQDDDAMSPNARINYALTASGIWTIHATTSGGHEVGMFDLALKKCNETITTPAVLTRALSGGSCSESIRGNYHWGKVFSFNGIAGRTVVIDMTSSQFDTYLYLMKPDGSIAAFNNDTNGTNSHIAFVLPSSGVWSIHATSNTMLQSGTYQLSVDQQSCAAPDATISAPASICSNGSGTASVPVASSYAWSIQNGTFTSAATLRTITFTPTGTAPVVLTVNVTASCNSTATNTVEVPVSGPTATVSGNHQIAQGGSQTISATLTGAGPWTVVWAPGNLTRQATTTTATLLVNPDVTTHYTISQVTDSTGCSRAGTGEAVVTVVPPAPTQLSATATSATAVQLAWTFAGSTDDFAVDRCASGCASPASWAQIGVTTSLAYVDSVAIANKSYLYRVRSRKGGTSSAASTADVATTVIVTNAVADAVIDDSPIVQLRTAVQAMATLAGSAQPTITGSDLTDAVVLSVHLGELRTALTSARASLGLPAVTYSTVDASIRAADVNELRGGVQ